MPDGSGRSATWLGWLLLAGCAVLVLQAPQPAWAGPAVPAAPAAWADWVRAQGAVPAAFAFVRLATFAVGLQLAVVVLTAAVVRATAGGGVAQVLRTAAPPMARRLVDVVAGVGVLALAVPPVGAATSRAARPPGAMHLAAAADPVGVTPTTEPEREVIVPADDPVPATDPAPAAPAPSADVWEVRPGEHFWSIAEQVLTTSWGRPVTDAEVAPYWVALVDANRDRLASPGDPDLVYPGQLMALPAVPPAPATPAGA